MYAPVVIILALVVGGASLYISLKIMKRFRWFLAWLRGSFGLVFLGIALIVFVIAVDLSDYEELLNDRPIATISFEQLDTQLFKAEVSYYIGMEPASYEIHGDQWQVDARIIRWSDMILSLGARSGYKLERISGRYYSLEEERSKKRSVYSLQQNEAIIDVWDFMLAYSDYLPGVNAMYGNAAFLPMADSATFQLSLGLNGLTAKPMNEMAKSAMQLWQ